MKDNEMASGPGELETRALTEYIVQKYHMGLRRKLPELCELSLKVEKAHAHSPDLPAGLSVFLKAFTIEMFTHMDKEEQILFPMIIAGRSNFVGAPIARMEFEHGQHEEAIRKLRRMTNNFSLPNGACATWASLYEGFGVLEKDISEHVNLENNILFPRALNLPIPDDV